MVGSLHLCITRGLVLVNSMLLAAVGSFNPWSPRAEATVGSEAHVKWKSFLLKMHERGFWKKTFESLHTAKFYAKVFFWTVADDTCCLQTKHSEPTRALCLLKFFCRMEMVHLAKVTFESQKLLKREVSCGKVCFQKFFFLSGHFLKKTFQYDMGLMFNPWPRNRVCLWSGGHSCSVAEVCSEWSLSSLCLVCYPCVRTVAPVLVVCLWSEGTSPSNVLTSNASLNNGSERSSWTVMRQQVADMLHSVMQLTSSTPITDEVRHLSYWN